MSFRDQAQQGIFQIMVFPREEYRQVQDLAQKVLSVIDIREKQQYEYECWGKPAILAELQFLSGSDELQGFFFFYQGEKAYYYILSMAPLPLFEKQEDVLLSFMDSFSPQRAMLKTPGLVSQFYSPFPAVRRRYFSLDQDFANKEFTVGLQERGTSQKIIEREARILVPLAQEKVNRRAWKRYYQVIMRDYHPRLRSLHLVWASVLRGKSDRQKAEILLEWVQSFQYHREENSTSDLLSPLEAALSGRGDCDARVLLYLSLLKMEGIDGVLMVSEEYSHALAGVLVDGSGARFSPPGGEQQGYIVAETTDQVDLGLINRDMADPAHWFAIPFPF